MPNGSGIFYHPRKYWKNMPTITDDVGNGPIRISMPPDLDENRRAEERAPITASNDDVSTTLDGKRHRIDVSYRPGQPLPLASVTSAVDNGPRQVASNDNQPVRYQPVRYHLKEMVQREELGINEPENRRHWFAVERLKRDIAVASGEPLSDSAAHDWRELREENLGERMDSLDIDVGLVLTDDMDFQDIGVPSQCAAVDNAEGENDEIRFLYARQVLSLAEEVLGPDYKVLRHVIVDNWTARMIGENELYMDRITASSCGKGMIRSALRNLARFYDSLDRLELTGDRPLDVWPLIGTQYPTVVHPRPFRLRHDGCRYLNQTAGPVIRVVGVDTTHSGYGILRI
jgi:hypothetical protein